MGCRFRRGQPGGLALASDGAMQRGSDTPFLSTVCSTNGGIHFTRSAETAGRSSGTGGAAGAAADDCGAGVIGGGSAAGARDAGEPGGGPSWPPNIPQAERHKADRIAAPPIISFMTRPSTCAPKTPLPWMDNEASGRQVAATGQPFSLQSFFVAARPTFSSFSNMVMSTSASLLM